MPKITGRDLTEAIRKNKKTKTQKFTFLTIATFRKKGEEELKRMGSLDYIKRPFANDNFVKRIKVNFLDIGRKIQFKNFYL